MNPNIFNTVSFAGNRMEKLNIFNDWQFFLIEDIVRFLIKYDYTSFLIGGCNGIDLICGEIIIKLKHELNTYIDLTAVLPFKEQAKSWPDEWKARYYNVLQQCDKTLYISDDYFRGCYHQRNRVLVNKCSLLVAIYSEFSGGTKYTVQYAKKQQKNIMRVKI